MGSDAFFRMGSTHAICQDYAIAGSHKGTAYAIVSDGCSGVSTKDEPGSPFTDYGARFITRAARLILPAFDETLMMLHAQQMAVAACLPASCLDATAIVAKKEKKGVRVHQCGDGVIAARDRRTGQIAYMATSFDSNMPFYPSYLLTPAIRARYLRTTRSMTLKTGGQIEGGAWKSGDLIEIPLNHEESESSVGVQTHFFPDSFDVVLIMSDGAESFQNAANGQPVPLTDVLEQLFAFKGFEGEFITRRCTRFLHKFCVEKGWKHTDDLSVAGIYVPQTEDSGGGEIYAPRTEPGSPNSDVLL